MNRIIFGGTFDPIHKGHIRIAEAILKKVGGELIFVPAKSPRWKEPLTDANHRLNMLKAAILDSGLTATIEEFELNSNAEINYSVDTVQYLYDKYPDDKLYFIIGADQVNQFEKWKDGDVIAKLATIIYVNRPRYELNQENIKRYNMVNSEFFDSGDVSSSEIRELKLIETTDGVLRYIEENHLYYVKEMEKYIDSHRLTHSISVAKLAVEINRVNGKPLNEYKVYVAALLHDIGKLLKDTTPCGKPIEELMRMSYPEYIDTVPPFAYHQFVGARIAKNHFEIEDEEILDAIRWHATGKANMSLLGMLVYASDKIDPLRDFDSTWLIDACKKDIYEGFITTVIDNKKYLINHAKDIYNPYTKACFEMYIKEE